MTEASFAERSALVIEDEPFTRTVIARMLTNLGFKAVHQAGDGASALSLARAERPDIVVCDVEMQPVDGLGFLRELRAGQDGHGRVVPVVFMTNRVDPVIVAQSRTLGADVFLPKPVNAAGLKETLAHALLR